ncbi:hypothetical protein HK099_007071, partial [Clydaea vesicula]
MHLKINNPFKRISRNLTTTYTQERANGNEEEEEEGIKKLEIEKKIEVKESSEEVVVEEKEGKK